MMRSVQRDLARRDLGMGTPAQLQTIMWAFATLDIPSRVLYDKVANEALRRIEFFTAPSLSTLIWAYGSAHMINQTLFERVQHHSSDMAAKPGLTLQASNQWGLLADYVDRVRVRVLMRV